MRRTTMPRRKTQQPDEGAATRRPAPSERDSTEHRRAPHAPNPEASAVRGFWSGTLAFGLVSIPVDLITAQRTTRVAARMLGPDGTPLRRRYFCSRHDVPLDTADIVRGYEVEKDRFVVVTDDELRALAPKLSQEIDLTRFVPLSAIDPMHFEHGYFLVPGKRAGKAYRLLAQVMELRARAGIATFVMRGKQYLVAIIASCGLLRAQTLRFTDELRSTEDIGFGERPTADESAHRELERHIDALRADALAADELDDTYTQRLLELIERKHRAGRDVIAAQDARFEDSTGAQIVDLLQYLKDSIAGSSPAAPSGRKRPRAAAGGDVVEKPARRTRRSAKN